MTTITKSLFSIKSPVHREGCPSQLTPYYLCKDASSQWPSYYTTMRLIHKTKDQVIKNFLLLDQVHHQLELNSLILQGSGSSNILLSGVSFDCLVINSDETETREYFVFDLRIPGANTTKESVFSYDRLIEGFYSREQLYSNLKRFYSLGKNTVNPTDNKHGHKPLYDPKSSKHDQYILHTEQLLVAYLSTLQSAYMLRNRLRTEIRAKHPDVCQVKVYNMGLHMHSTKTCCAPCEYSLIGLMNRRERGFLPNFQKVCLEQNDLIKFCFPQKSKFSLLVTVTASEHDADHQKQPTYTAKKLALSETVLPTDISVKDALTSRRIFTTFLNKHEISNPFTSSSLNDATVAISGSKKTPGSTGTIIKTKTSRKKEWEDDLEEVKKQINFLQIY